MNGTKIPQSLFAVRRPLMLSAAIFLFTVLPGCPTEPESDTPTTYLQQHSPTDVVGQGIVTGRYYEDMVADPELFFDTWYDMDIEWIRIEFEEFMNLPTLADYDNEVVQERREMYQAIIDHAHKRNIKVLGVVGVNAMPGWIYLQENDEGEQEILGNGLERYVESVEWHITTYGVDAIEVWNEPRQFTFTDVDGTLARLPEYARLLIETYSQLKPDYPEVTFVAPATSNAFEDTYVGTSDNPQYSIFNSDVMRSYRDQNDGALPLDVISWHPYGRTVSSGGGPKGDFYYRQTFADYHENVLSFTDSDGRTVVGNYPIWLTEYGFEEAQTAGEANQRQYYEDMIDVMNQYPAIKVIFWYTYLDDDPDAAGTQNMTYGMRQYDPPNYTPKQVFHSFTGLSAGVGMLPDCNVVDPMVDFYLEKGGKSAFGIPAETVQTSGNTRYQSFSGGSRGAGTLSYDGSLVVWSAED